MPVRPRPIAALAACAVVTAVLLTSPGDAAYAAPGTCQGHQATVAAVAGNRYQGTPGPDVVVAVGRAPYVDAGDGDDLVCVASADRGTVSAGRGADTVTVTDRSTDYRGFRVELGEGDDLMRGGPGQDVVGSLEDESTFYEQGFDTIDTGPGRDVATLGSDDRRTHHVDLDLGPDDDRVSFYGGGVTADSVVDGGSDRDLLDFNSDDEGTDVTIDAAGRTVDRAGRVVSSWSAFEDYAVKEFGAAVRFRGSSASETLDVSAARTYDIDMAGGRDRLTLSKPLRGRASGGAGRDRIVEDSTRGVDLAEGTIGRFPITSFQDATSTQGSVTGDGQANDLVFACDTARGGAGADRLTVKPLGYVSDRGPCTDHTALGGRGNDELRGSRRDDRLIGGPGSDLAVGRAGRDVCVAERVRSC